MVAWPYGRPVTFSKARGRVTANAARNSARMRTALRMKSSLTFSDTRISVCMRSQSVAQGVTSLAKDVPKLQRVSGAKVETARKSVPSLQHGRRFGIADPKAGPEHLHLVRGSA